jgi:hypothetical protein
MELLCLDPLDFNQGVSEIFDINLLDPWIPDPPTEPSVIDGPLIVKRSAPRETDWDEKKPTIEHIYLNENQTLNATMARMREHHGFSATWVSTTYHFLANIATYWFTDQAQ